MRPSSILVVDDESDIRSTIQEILSEEGYSVETAADASEAKDSYRTLHPDLVLLDIWMPDIDGITLLKQWSEHGDLNCPVVVMSGHGTVETAVEATRLGAVDFIEKPLSLAQLLRTVQGALATRALPGKTTLLAPATLSIPPARSAAMKALRTEAETLAKNDGPVMLTGEPGTGREAYARFIHTQSPRKDQAFIAISGAALTERNAADQLIGFHTADGTEPGALELANGGTLFIDELQSLGEEAQSLLLRVVEGRELMLVGSNSPVALNLRVFASLQAGANLRSDLLSALSVNSLSVPPLRECRDDIAGLLRFHVDRLVEKEGLRFRRFGVAAQNRLRNYGWPGNIRELIHLVKCLLLTGGPEEVGLDEIEPLLGGEAPASPAGVPSDLLRLPMREAREEFERAYLTQQLAVCDGKVGRLAERVGMERTHLYRKLRALGVVFSRGSANEN
ncbi:MAG: sigma-54-dependent transcriptional regulator [Gammaproteobacteria bacterium]